METTTQTEVKKKCGRPPKKAATPILKEEVMPSQKLEETVNKIVKEELKEAAQEIKAAISESCDKVRDFATPPISWQRNQYGLLSHIKYKWNEDGSINWRGLVKTEYLVPNRQNFEKRSEPVPASIESVEDKDLLILLAGIKELAQIRGFTAVDYDVISSNPEYVSVKCTICWLPNFETSHKAVCFSALADATVNNTMSFAKNFLHTIAENRAFVRAVRNFLRIHILGQDEVGNKTTESEEQEEQSKFSPASVLHKKLNSEPRRFKDFEQFKNWAALNSYNDQNEKFIAGEKNYDSNNWGRVSDVPKSAILDIIGKLDKLPEVTIS
jgi:hypothetical protein